MTMVGQFRNQPAVIFRLYPFVGGDVCRGDLDIGGAIFAVLIDIPNQATILVDGRTQSRGGCIIFQNQCITQIGGGIAADETTGFCCAAECNGCIRVLDGIFTTTVNQQAEQTAGAFFGTYGQTGDCIGQLIGFLPIARGNSQLANDTAGIQVGTGDNRAI